MYVAVCKKELVSDCSEIEWQKFTELHAEQYFSVTQLKPADLGEAFAAGFVTLGTVLITVKIIGVVLSILKGR